MLDSRFQKLLWFSFFFKHPSWNLTFRMIVGAFDYEPSRMRLLERQLCFFCFFAVLQGVLHLHSVLAVLHISLTLFAFYVHSIVSALIITHAKAQFSLISLPHPFPSPPLKKMMKSYIVLYTVHSDNNIACTMRVCMVHAVTTTTGCRLHHWFHNMIWAQNCWIATASKPLVDTLTQ